MEAIEYRGVVDKTAWARGTWDSEPDKVQWQDDATGMPCLIVRGPCGFLCGYVGVPERHPWHGKDYDCIDADVHGGLTFAGACQTHTDDPARKICHIPDDGEPDDVWWLGFDCGHVGDLTNMKYRDEMRRHPPADDVYRDMAYVRAEVIKLARQAFRVVHDGN